MSLILKSFKITQKQGKWLNFFSKSSGLPEVEILRRALDYYAEEEERKERQRLFPKEERSDLKALAAQKGTSERQIIREAVRKEVRVNRKKRPSKRG